jgi:hypothetical protein
LMFEFQAITVNLRKELLWNSGLFAPRKTG